MADLDPKAELIKLASKSTEFRELSLQSRLDIVDEILSCLRNNDWSNAGSWVKAEVSLLGYVPKSGDVSNTAKRVGAFKRHTISSCVSYYMRTLKSSLSYQLATEKGEEAQMPALLDKVSNFITDEGELSIHGPLDIPLIPGHTFELWTDPTAPKEEEKNATKAEDTTGGVAVVLGAGNQSALTIIDIFQCLFVHPRLPVFVKHHPLRPWLHEPYSMILEPLIKRGFVHMIPDGGIPLTKSLLSCKEVSHVHLTGALSTANAVKESLALTRPHLSQSEVDDMVTSELGCSTPIVFSPGSYTETEMRNAAKMIVYSKKFDAGCNCLCAQAVILPEKWGQKEKFKELLTEEFMTAPTDPCYYPGSYERCSEFSKDYDESQTKEMNSEIFTTGDVHEKPDMHPVVAECGVFGTKEYNGLAVQKEAFGPFMSIVELSGGESSSNTDEYFSKTVAPYLNDKDNIFGTLSCSVMIPESIENKEKVQKNAVAALKYGSIAINSWTAVNYNAMLSGAIWCGHRRELKKQSGNGYIGNHFSIPNVEKTVVYTTLSKNMFDKNNEPPAIVLDALYYVAISKTNMEAFLHVFILLLIRFVSFILQLERIFGMKAYGSAL